MPYIKSKASLPLATLTLLCVLLASCAPGKKPVVESPPKTYKFLFQTQASWYGKEFQGRKTASGERFNMHELTAAHRTLPFGTKLLVKNISNQKKVVVRVNDRGPFAKGRGIDVSFAAASRLGFISQGETVVRVYKEE